MSDRIRRGDVVYASLDPTKGHEQSGERPHLVISRERHQKLFGLVIAVPMTRTKRPWPTHVEIEPGSYALCEQPRTLAVARITGVDPRGLTDKADQVVMVINRLVNGL